VSDDKLKGALPVAASVIAAVRLAREPIKDTPRVLSGVADSVKLARMILRKIQAEQP
jgi:hypothetical protein